MQGERIDFEVILGSSPTSLDDWRRAQTADPSELPALNNAQKEVAKKLCITEDQYQRSYLSLVYGRERMLDRTRNLGTIVEKLLEETSRNYRLLAIAERMDQGQWIAEIKVPRQLVNVEIPRELGDDLLDSRRSEYRIALKELLLSALRGKQLNRKKKAQV